jgi:hypothetical protein
MNGDFYDDSYSEAQMRTDIIIASSEQQLELLA